MLMLVTIIKKNSLAKRTLVLQVAQLNILSNLNLLQDLQASAIMVFCFNQKVALANILSTNSLNCCMFITQNYSGSSAEARCGTPEVRRSHFRVKPTIYNSLFRRHQTGKEESIAAKAGAQKEKSTEACEPQTAAVCG